MSKFTAWFSRADRDSEQASAPASPPDAVTVGSPLDGALVPLDQVEDAMFSTGVMGPGVAVRPEVGELRAPFAGIVRAVFPTGHAVGIASDSGLEVLMHIGIDTVDLGGAHFDTVVTAGQHVDAGDLLVRFDAPAIREAGYPVTTPMVVLDADGWELTIDATPGDIRVGDPLITARRIDGA